MEVEHVVKERLREMRNAHASDIPKHNCMGKV